MSSATKDVNSFSTPNKALPKQNEANTFWGHDQLRVHFVELTPWAKKRCPWRFSVICFDSLKGRHQSMSWHLELTPVVYSVIFLDSRWHKTWELPAFQFTNLFHTKIVKFDEFMSKKSTLMLTGWFEVSFFKGRNLWYCPFEAPSARIQILLNPQLFLSGYGFRLHLSGESGIRIHNFLNPLSREEIFEYAMNPKSCGR